MTKKLGRKPIYPFNKIRIGKSMFFKTNDPDEQDKIRNTASHYAVRYRKIFRTIKSGDGVRIYRLA